MSEMKRKTLVMACREFFGYLPGQTLKEFGDELKQLSQDERDEFGEMFENVGYEIIPADGRTAI